MAEISRQSYLISKFAKIPISINYNNKKMDSFLHGEICLKVFLARDGKPKLDMQFFNTIADSLKTTEGETGLLSFTFITDKSELDYNHENGSLGGYFLISLHYPLIDKKKGWKLSEPDNFIPYTETFKVKVKGRFHKPIKPSMTRIESLIVSMEFEPFGEGVLKQIKGITLADTNFYFNSSPPSFWFPFTRHLPVQPVFIRNNDQDPSPSGVSFNTLLANANTIWQKCCIQFDALTPIFVNNSSYRILSESEMQNLRNEVNVVDAIEIFVVDAFDPVAIANTGGGSTWSGGTANAKIITGDNQLPLNQHHLGHELGHVLKLDHPGSSDPAFIPGCSNTVMEPSGFFADNPDEQCGKNCLSATNPLVQSHWHWCRIKPDI
jgi:hypothetical protein